MSDKDKIQGRPPKNNAERDERIMSLEEKVTTVHVMLMEEQDRRKEDKERRQKYDAYLDTLMKKAEADAEFWQEAKQKIILQGAWATIGIICFACWYTLKDTLKTT